MERARVHGRPDDPKGVAPTAALAVGFGAAVAMWAVGYLGRLPATMLPSPVVLVLMLGCLFGAGMWLGRRAEGSGPTAAAAGLITGLLNLLVLGSFLGGDRPDRIVPSALWWIPGSILVAAALVAVGAWAGRRRLGAVERPVEWDAAFVRVAVAATLLLLAVGGLVTSAEAGLAVDDWPTSFGYNMFLYPLSRMTGGIYYEHAHRLFGALVGLTTLVMALVLQFHRGERRGWLRGLGWMALVLVVLQGVLGGIRVTERSLALAMAHGVLGQLFFGTLVAMAVFTSRIWRRPPPDAARPSVGTDRALAGLLVGLIVAQLVLGAAQRHFQVLLVVHMISGLAFVAPLAVAVGIRAWGLNPSQPVLQRLGLGLVATVGLQVLLGLGAYVATSGVRGGGAPGVLDLTLATAHQWVGAMLLGGAVVMLCLDWRLLTPVDPARLEPAAEQSY